MTFEQFEKYINHIREHIELIAELNEACRKREENNTSFGYSILTDDIIEMLEIIFKDKFQWIEYWAYELNFGKNYKDGCCSDKNGIIKLQTCEDLWKVLNGIR